MAIVTHPAMIKTVCMGRRWGKTFTAGVLSAETANAGARVAWVAATYRNSRPLWRFVEALSVQDNRIRVRASEHEIIMPSGGSVAIYSADNPVSLRGEAFDLVICDEAPQYTPEVWSDVLMPTLADRDGRAYLIGTPKGRNWFYHEYMRGLTDGKLQASFNAPSAANPMPQIQRAAELARERVSARTYRQEWLAEFVTDGAFFVGVDAAATLAPQPYKNGHSYSIGVDWARSTGGDWTVFAVMDATTQGLAAIERLNGQAYDVQLSRLTALWQSYGCPPILAEANSMGGPLIEGLQRGGLSVTGFTTTAASKHEIITALELALERGEIKIINDPALIMELNAYEKRDRSGLPAYSAPPGMHDDTVIALALALQMARGSGIRIGW